MASSISPISSSAVSDGSSSSTAALSPDQAPTEQMFLQLLVAQIKNQDPLNPTDSVQFVSQLAQFSELEQVIAIRGDLDTMKGAGATTTSTANNNSVS